MSTGIKIVDCENAIVSGNTIRGCRVGIDAESVRNLDLRDNVVAESSEEGIRLKNVCGLVVENNSVLLGNVPEELVLEAIRAVSEAKPENAERALKQSRLGAFLSEQRFVEWASLVLSIVAFLKM